MNPRMFILPNTTPIEPVIVAGCATIASDPIATQYPPDPATDDMLTTTGFPAAWARSIDRHTRSLPTALPPGLFTRNTIALTSGFSTASSIASATSGPYNVPPEPNGLSSPDPETTGPSPNTTAMACPAPGPGSVFSR
jgi:hypothetical protein